jgi:hypothetical protein
MGLNSVEMIMELERAFGIHIPDEEAFKLRTPRMTYEFIAQRLGAVDEARRACLTLRAFNRLRASAESAAMIDRRNYRPAARLRDLADRKRWGTIRVACGIASLPKPGLLFSPRTVGELTLWTVINVPRDLKPVGEPWSRSEVRCIVRAVVADTTGLDEFGDDDDFIKDMGLD